MIRLVVEQANGTPYQLDVYGDENIPVTFSIDDMTNFEGKTTSYSKEFDLPATRLTKRQNI